MKLEFSKKIDKIVVNAGIGKISSQPNFADKILPEIIKEFALITGQKPAQCPAKKSISGFKIREGMIVGLKTTLRSGRMRDFLMKVSKVILPRIRDFRGISDTSIDQNGNLTLGIKENVAFPEVNPEITKTNFGVEITIVPKSVKNREEAIAMYQELGIPFKKNDKLDIKYQKAKTQRKNEKI